MIKYLIFSVLISLSFGAMAQTVALHRNGETQIFKGITAFVDANNVAIDGDTLYLSGHNFNVPASFDKSLKIYGVGHLEEATITTGKTYINGDILLKEDADNFLIEGIDFGSLSVENNKSVKNLTIKRCNIRGNISFAGTENPSEDFLLTGSVIHSTINLQNTERSLLSNNIILGQISITNENIIKNNIFISDFSSYTIWGSFNMVLNNYFARNHRYDKHYICSGDGNVFYNNVLSFTSANFGTNSDLQNNLLGIEMQDFFVDKNGSGYNVKDDLHLQNPEIYIGEDGTQIGIYGGMYPYKEGAIPVLPYIESVDIPHKLDENGNLPVEIRVRAQSEED